MNVPVELILSVGLGIQAWTLKQLVSIKEDVAALRQWKEDTQKPKANPYEQTPQNDPALVPPRVPAGL